MSNLSPSEQDKLDLWLTLVQTEARGLTKWEEDYIESLSIQWEEKRWMSQKQAEILERIYVEKTR